MATMKVVRFYEYGEPDVLKYEDEEMPKPDKGQVLVKIEAVGINYADTMRRRNNYLENTPVPCILGGEIAGTVAELGEGVTNVEVGARVLGLANMGYAQYCVLPARQVFPIPDFLSFEQAVTLPVQGMTAYDILKVSGQLKPGESVLVHAAAGGVGIYSVQLAKLMGAGKVIATASTDAKLELAKSLGADELVNYSDPEWYKKVKDLTDGKGADVILEMVGGEVTNQNLKCLATFGRMVVFGAASRQIPSINPMQLMYKNHAVIGYWLVNTITRPAMFAQGLQELLGWIAEGKLKMIVEHTYPLSETAKAHTEMEGRQTVGKLVLLPHA
jgi:NADPH2:quinone reductase